MISRIIFICIFIIVKISAFNTGKLNQYEILSKRMECEANKVYQKNDVTCFCNEYGRWPHKNCSVVFNIHPKIECKPGSYVQVGCNVCRCSTTGNIVDEFCTKHSCNADTLSSGIFRRTIRSKNKCDLNHWYIISSCRLCFCITKENLLCAAQTNPLNTHIGKYNLTDCGPNWLSDINKLLSSVNPLRFGNNGKKHNNDENQADTESAESQIMVQVQTTPKPDIPKDDIQSISFIREMNGNKKVNIGRNDDKNENNDEDSSFRSNSDENIEEGKPIARIAGNTVMPFDDEEINGNNNSNELGSDTKISENESVDSKESEEEDVTTEVKSALGINKNEEKREQDGTDLKLDKSFFKLNIPGVLGRVFNFGLRKSMLSLDNANCKPGSTARVKCNTCFCLNNGKMLCTKKMCN